MLEKEPTQVEESLDTDAAAWKQGSQLGYDDRCKNCTWG